MATKLLVHVETDDLSFGVITSWRELTRLPLEPASSYLIQASGRLDLKNGEMVWLRLEVRDFFGRPVATTGEAFYVNVRQQFLVSLPATVPDMVGGGAGSGPPTPPPPGASATLLVKTSFVSPPPGASVSLEEAVITALEVDELVVA